MRHRGFSAWGIQTGPFAACQTDFVTKNFHLLAFHAASLQHIPFLYIYRVENGNTYATYVFDSDNQSIHAITNSAVSTFMLLRKVNVIITPVVSVYVEYDRQELQMSLLGPMSMYILMILIRNISFSVILARSIVNFP